MLIRDFLFEPRKWEIVFAPIAGSDVVETVSSGAPRFTACRPALIIHGSASSQFVVTPPHRPARGLQLVTMNIVNSFCLIALIIGLPGSEWILRTVILEEDELRACWREKTAPAAVAGSWARSKRVTNRTLRGRTPEREGF
jgi:hypothetical protein